MAEFGFDPMRALVRLRAVAPAAAKRMVEEIRPHAPIAADRPDGREGGALRDGLAVKSENIQNGVSFHLTSDQSYAQFVVKGTKPHTIEARNARALRFWIEGDTIRFAKRVHHPGTQPNPFYHEADDGIRQVVRQEAGLAVRSVLRP